ncbi:uncharacterized protein LOC110021430 [Phalaenopsis equestris]|uniref:uncharacterized protein LOC110021430 n=1 Tax=Phalaenopsis equestris TaxID=78828 RepID=UPI0009E4C637|nr:uncharacterized protein LOC110021430 [Phalaenopsis equestris]
MDMLQCLFWPFCSPSTEVLARQKNKASVISLLSDVLKTMACHERNCQASYHEECGHFSADIRFILLQRINLLNGMKGAVIVMVVQVFLIYYATAAKGCGAVLNDELYNSTHDLSSLFCLCRGEASACCIPFIGLLQIIELRPIRLLPLAEDWMKWMTNQTIHDHDLGIRP